MSIVKSLVKFVTDAKPVSTLAELEEGRAAVEGVIELGEEGGIISPINGRPCVAFYYKAYHFTGSRTGQMMPRKLKTEEVYAPFVLRVDDGKLRAVPKKSSSFTAAQHKELTGVGYEGFVGLEELVLSGTKVRLWGVAKKTDEGVVLTYTKIELFGGEATDGQDKSKRRKKKKAKAKKKK